MKMLLRKAVKTALRTTGKSRVELAYSVLPSFLLELMDRYLRVRSEGLQHIPKEGPCIVIANHSGYMGFDALMLGYQIYRKTGRIPRIVAHKLWFFHPDFSVHIKRLGLIPATYENAAKIVEQGDVLILFPEGEEGNFKPSRYRYRLRRFRRGFARIALRTGAPIVHAVVIGAEETHITLSQIRWAKHLLGIIIPIPLNVLPLPVKWFIRFYKPVNTKQDIEKSSNKQYVTQLSRTHRTQLQQKLTAQVRRRHNLFI